MKTAIIGSRSITDYALLLQVVTGINITEVISGGAVGVDQLAERYAQENGLALTIIRPNWRTDGKKAGMMRNQQIVEASDQVIAIWDGYSRGTEATIKMAKKVGKPTKTHQIGQETQMKLF